MVTEKDVVARISLNRVVAAAAQDYVIPGTAADRIASAHRGVHGLDPEHHPVLNRQCPAIPEDDVISVVTIYRVTAGLPPDPVIPGAPVNRIVSADGRISGCDRYRHLHKIRNDFPIVPQDHVVSGAALDIVVPVTTQQVVVSVTTVKFVVAADTREGLDEGCQQILAAFHPAVISYQHVGKGPTAQFIIAGAADEDAFIQTCIQIIVASGTQSAEHDRAAHRAVVTDEHVAATHTIQSVVSATAEDHIVSGSAVNRVIAFIAPGLGRHRGKAAVIAVEHIVSGTTVDGIVARTAEDPVIPVLAVNLVVTGTAVDDIVARTPVDIVVPVLTVDGVVARTAVNRVAAGTTVNDIVAIIPINGVVACAAVDRVIARTAVDRVVAALAVDRVVADAAVYPIIPVTAVDRVIAGTAVDRVIAGTALEKIVSGTAVDVAVSFTCVHLIISQAAIEEAGS